MNRGRKYGSRVMRANRQDVAPTPDERVVCRDVRGPSPKIDGECRLGCLVTWLRGPRDRGWIPLRLASTVEQPSQCSVLFARRSGRVCPGKRICLMMMIICEACMLASPPNPVSSAVRCWLGAAVIAHPSLRLLNFGAGRGPPSTHPSFNNNALSPCRCSGMKGGAHRRRQCCR